MPQSDEPGPDTAELYKAAASAMSEYVALATSAAESNPVEAASTLVRNVDAFIDRQIEDAQSAYPEKVACKAGCCWCCRGAIAVTGPELVNIFRRLQQLGAAHKERLTQRLEKSAADFAEAGQNRDEWSIVCPLLEDGLCIAYEDRPLMCRRASSFDAGICRALVDSPDVVQRSVGLQSQASIADQAIHGTLSAFRRSHLPSSPFLLAPALNSLFREPELQARLLTEPTPVEPYVGPSGTRFFEAAHGEVSGSARPDPIAIEGAERIRTGNVTLADSRLSNDNPAQLLAKLQLPRVYESEDQLLEMRARYEMVLGELIHSKFNPREVFNQLETHHTFLLAYQGLPVRAILEKHGTWLHSIAARALPHLAEPIATKRKPGKPRVGYISSQLNNSNGSAWALGWLSNHSKEIETHAFLTGVHYDPVSARFRSKADHFYWLQGNLQLAAEFIKSLDLDVLIYTDLGMSPKNYQYSSLRLARTQCTAWGHPVTSGLPTIDCYLSSDLMEPENAQSEYSEKLVRLPNTGLYFRRPAFFASRRSASDFGIAEDRFIFMGQQLSKWTPRWDHLIARIFQKTGRTMVTVRKNETFALRLQKLGVPIVALAEVSSYEYSRLLQLADVSIDPPDWSGGNTTVESLSLGTPVVTLPGQFMRGRHSYAFLTMAGAKGLIASDEDDFVDLVVNRDRREAVPINPDPLYEDISVVKTLDDFILAEAKT